MLAWFDAVKCRFHDLQRIAMCHQQDHLAFMLVFQIPDQAYCPRSHTLCAFNTMLCLGSVFSVL